MSHRCGPVLGLLLIPTAIFAAPPGPEATAEYHAAQQALENLTQNTAEVLKLAAQQNSDSLESQASFGSKPTHKQERSLLALRSIGRTRFAGRRRRTCQMFTLLALHRRVWTTPGSPQIGDRRAGPLSNRLSVTYDLPLLFSQAQTSLEAGRGCNTVGHRQCQPSSVEQRRFSSGRLLQAGHGFGRCRVKNTGG